MDGHLEILKSLIDSLTVQLTNIIIKIESINPILNRLLDESEKVNNIGADNKNQLNEIKKEISNCESSVEKIPELSTDIKSINTNLETIKKMLIPVNKYSRMVMKPLTIAIFIIMIIGSIVGVIESFRFFVGK